jgi:hypothetical protein
MNSVWLLSQSHLGPQSGDVDVGRVCRCSDQGVPQTDYPTRLLRPDQLSRRRGFRLSTSRQDPVAGAYASVKPVGLQERFIGT